jgi:two-component system, NarL family, sensor kinase
MEARRWTVAAVAAALVIAAAILVLHLVNRGAPKGGLTVYGPNQGIDGAVLTVLGALILRRHRRHSVGWIMVVSGMATATAALSNEYVVLGLRRGRLLPGADLAYWYSSFAWLPAYGFVAPMLLLLLPDGRPLSRAWSLLVAVGVVMLGIDLVSFALSGFEPGMTGLLATLRNPFAITPEPWRIENHIHLWGAAAVVSLLGCLACHLARLSRAGDLERRQLEWVTIGTVVWLTFSMTDSFVHFTNARPLLELPFILLPALGATIGVVRHNLLDIDRLVHRGVLAVVFAAGAGGAYAFVLTLASRVFGIDNVVAQTIAVAAVATAALPGWRRVDAAVERMLYGERERPLEVLSRLDLELATAPTAGTDVLGRVADGLVLWLRVPFVGVEVDGVDRVVRGDVRPPSTTIPLVHEGQRLGGLIVGHRSDTEPLAEREVRLLDGLAHRVADAVHAMGLTEALRQSQERLVLAREEERRRIRHDLHDGLGPQLAGIGLQLDLSKELFDRDPAAAANLLSVAKDELSTAILAVRRVVDGLRPPALDDLGLVGAIRQQASLLDGSIAGGLEVVVDAPDDLGPLPAATEVAALRIAVEAATNAARHAAASTCTIRLRVRDALHIEVSDDGQGIQAETAGGVGLVSLRHRAEELGGAVTINSGPGRGTCVSASLPLARP